MKKQVKNNVSIIYSLLEHKVMLMGIIASISFVLKFTLVYTQLGITFLQALSSALEFASIITASIIAILIYFKDRINTYMTNNISKNNYTAIFGLGAFSVALLSNELKENKTNYIIFEKNSINEKIEYFKKMGMGVVEGDALESSSLEKLNFETMEYAIIAMGDDRLNIELAIRIISLYKEKKIVTPIKLVIHIINKELDTLFHQNVVLSEDGAICKIDIKTFSFYTEVAEKFFEENDVDGEDDSIMQGKDEYSIAIVGNGELALSMIFQIGKLAHLPNENLLNIHLVDKEAEKFKQKVISHYEGINNVLKLHTHNRDDETMEYYVNKRESLWNTKNLTHVIICYDDEARNLNIAMNLFDKTYLSDAVDKTMKTRISFALFNTYEMGRKINNNRDNFKNFYSFGDVKKICTHENLLDEEDALLAKLIHLGYAEEYNPHFLYNLQDKKTLEAIHHKWYDASRLSDKLSSQAQSKHIRMKLKALGLKYIPSEKSSKELLTENRTLLDDRLKHDFNILKISESFLHSYSKELPKLWGEAEHPIDVRYFPEAYVSIFEKLIRAEHNRWNAFHYLNGWHFNAVKSKPKKQHNCLKPLIDFTEPELQLTVIYDMYAILYIPNYLANAGFEIVKVEEAK